MIEKVMVYFIWNTNTCSFKMFNLIWAPIFYLCLSLRLAASNRIDHSPYAVIHNLRQTYKTKPHAQAHQT